MPKISVIMPCLNMRKYIVECLNSVLGQTFKNIEVLVIDAGSTDGTLDILNNYICTDDRIVLISSKIKSYGYQVNLGIKKAVGEYIAIVDTDDRIIPDMFETLYSIAVRTGADYVKGTAYFFYTIQNKYIYQSKVTQFHEHEYEGNEIEVVPKDMPELFMKDPFLWYGIYRNDFIKKIRLHESHGAAYQDLGGLLQTQINAKKAVYIKKTVYEYRQDNINASEYNPKAFELVVNEYDWSKKFLENQALKWHTAFYLKFFSHVLTRFHVMVDVGYFWDDAQEAMSEIADRLTQALECGIIGEQNFGEYQWKQLQLFLKSPRELYQELYDAFNPMRINLHRIIQAVKEKDVVIYGSGRLGNFLHLQMLNNDSGNAIVFCDTNESLWGSRLHDIYVLNPQEAVSNYPDATYIIANKNCVDEMKERLIRFGISENQILYYTSGTDIRLFRRKYS